MYVSVYVYINIYIHVYVFICVCICYKPKMKWFLCSKNPLKKNQMFLEYKETALKASCSNVNTYSCIQIHIYISAYIQMGVAVLFKCWDILQ